MNTFEIKLTIQTNSRINEVLTLLYKYFDIKELEINEVSE
jgi:hypothetical protein